MKKILATGALALSLSVVGSAGSAATMLVGATFDAPTGNSGLLPGAIQVTPNNSNDCSGFFGKASNDPTDWCDVGNGLDPKTSISPWIAKYDTPGENPGGWSINDYFASLSTSPKGAEWDLDGATGSTTSGTWTYTPGVGDPAIRYWAAKAGTAFSLFWEVASDSTNCTNGLNASNYSLLCLGEAVQVTTGYWATPDNKGLSHLTFYDSTPMDVIPLPAAGWLLLAGVGGLAAMRRRKKAA